MMKSCPHTKLSRRVAFPSLLVLLTAGLLMYFSSSPSFAQPACLQYDVMQSQLNKQHEEFIVARGLGNNGQAMMELYATNNIKKYPNRNWTLITITMRPMGLIHMKLACVMASGTALFGVHGPLVYAPMEDQSN